MEINTINAALFAKMFLAGAKNLESKKEWINELNVFPVPDGDTGTNMTERSTGINPRGNASGLWATLSRERYKLWWPRTSQHAA